METLLLFLLITMATGDIVTEYQLCDTEMHGTLLSLDIDPCPQLPCNFQRNGVVIASMGFRTDVDITAARPVVYGYLGPLHVLNPFPFDPDACQSMTCPLAAGENTTYVATIPIQEIYPLVRVVAQWEIHDQEDRTIICFRVPAVITEAGQ